MTVMHQALVLEKETLRNLAGPELFMQTGLEQMNQGALVEVHGGSDPGPFAKTMDAIAGAILSGISSAVLSAIASGASSMLSSALVSGPPSAASSASAAATAGAAASAATGVASSGYSGYHSFDPPAQSQP